MAFIYGLRTEGSDEIRYIGVAENLRRRLHQHIRDVQRGETGHKANWIRQLIDQGGQEIEIVELAYFETSQEAFAQEESYIRAYREAGHRLTNMAEGGKGGAGTLASEDARQNHQEGMRERWERPGQREQHSERMQGHSVDDATRKKLSERASNRPDSLRQRIGAKAREWFSDPQNREQFRASQQDADVRRRKGEGVRQKWEDEAWREQRVQKQNSPEVKAKIKEGYARIVFRCLCGEEYNANRLVAARRYKGVCSCGQRLPTKDELH